jgi:hypothetical protein
MCPSSEYILGESLFMFLQALSERLPRCTLGEAICVHALGGGAWLLLLPDDMVHVSGFICQNTGIVAQVNAVFNRSRFLRSTETDVPSFDSHRNQMSS